MFTPALIFRETLKGIHRYTDWKYGDAVAGLKRSIQDMSLREE
jgi:hypothetical protein